ncbi:hypothetical protein RND71_020343 [Anisodus tanguticus]|uniref:Coatomer subunit epsilon n=1 Tax=Anisodus tanguticus TaxID=243964 RepID=A0AAE1VF96_9SOLA|nr:hypothetical protein RND71_020343 [Anisodus tanguticus]
MADPLFGLRNNLYIGAYQAAINNSDIPNLSQDDAVERDTLVYRSYIALGSYQLVINEIDASAATPLQAVKLLALYLSTPDNKETAIASLHELLGDPAIGSNPILRLIAGIVFMHEQDYNEALKHTNAGGTMDLDTMRNFLFDGLIAFSVTIGIVLTILWHALNVQILIKMHRSDYAEKQLRIMQQVDEDHTQTQLANAWLNLAVGGSKIQEAYLIFQDFSEKYQITSLILNGKAVCCMHMGNFDEAETLLLEALNKDAKDPETLANLVVCSLHLGKPSTRYLKLTPVTITNSQLRKYLSVHNTLMLILTVQRLLVPRLVSLPFQLKLSNPDHTLVKHASSAEESFDRAVQTVA